MHALSLQSANGIRDTATALVALGRKNGIIDILNPNTGALQCKIDPLQDDTSSIEGIHLSFQTAGAAPAAPILVSSSANGTARIHSLHITGTGNDTIDNETTTTSSTVSTTVRATWKVPATVCCTALEESASLLAVGSQGAELRLYDLSRPEGSDSSTAVAVPAFTAKGPKPNRIGLVDKPWTSAVSFFPDTHGTKIWTGTGHHKLRLYDSTSSKRPVIEVEWGQSRITALAPEGDGGRIWVGNGEGRVEAFDVRAGRWSGGVLKGMAGSVRSLALHPDHAHNRRLASAGLDRFLRVHDTKSRVGVGKVYLKTELTGVAWCPWNSTASTPSGGEEEEKGRAVKRRDGVQEGEDEKKKKKNNNKKTKVV